MWKKNKKTIFFYLGPAVMIIVIFLYLPIVLNLYNSFYKWGAMSKNVTFVGLQYYLEMFLDDVFYIAIKNNLVFIAMSLIGQIGVSLIIAAVLEQKVFRKFQSVFRTLYFIPSLLMVTVTGITFKMVYNPTLGFFNSILEGFGVNTSDIDILGNASSAIYGVAAASQWQYIGFTVVLFIVAIQNIPEEIYEAAAVDGANELQKLFKVTIPHMKDTIIVNSIIIITGAIRVFDEVYVMTSGGPGRSTETLATYLYQVGFKNDQMGYASAISFFIFIVTFALGLMQMRGYEIDD